MVQFAAITADRGGASMNGKTSRRNFLKTCAATGAAYKLNLMASPLKPSIAIIGAGAFGGWSALMLLRQGARVTLLDSWGPGNSRASSGGETRVIRCTYGPAKLHTEMAARALELWKENEQRWGLKLFFNTGALWMAGQDDAFERAALPVLKEAGVHFEQLSPADCDKRWPAINFEGVNWCLYEPDSGYLAARRACEAVLNAFIKEGGEYRQAQAGPGPIESQHMNSLVLNHRESIRADQYVFACGPWLGQVFSFLAPLVVPSRQEVFFFGLPPGDVQLPVWIDNGKHLFYGICGNHWRGFKIADDTRGPVVDPTKMEREVSESGLAAARAYMSMRFPFMSGAPLVESRVCQYENSSDQYFILDRHPQVENVWIVGGGSGHGFKHGPVVGEMVRDAVLGLKPASKEMSLSRFKQTASQQKGDRKARS
jgi:glycine/D-amino acid oxidase-like deaminating enzyme